MGRRTSPDAPRAAIRLIAVAALIALALTGCGGDDEQAEQAGNANSAAALELAVGISSTSTDALNYIARERGIFEEEGVDVSIQGNLGTNVPSLAASGKIDVAAYGGPAPLLLADQGRPTSIFYALTGGGIGGVVVADREKATSIQDLQQLEDCRLGTFPEGSSSYGYTTLYVEKYDLDCDVAPFQDNASLVGALASDRVDAMVGGYSNFASAIEDRDLAILVDTRDPDQRAEFIGPDVVEVMLWGITDRLEEKREAIVAYLKALDRARDYLVDPANADEAASLLAGVAEFEGTSEETIKSDVVGAFQAYLPAGGDEGFIDPATWERSLERYGVFGVEGFDAASPKFAYDEVVDMSYLEAATGGGER